MAYFYVKNSLGTRTTGGGTTKQTGSFTALGAANVYAKIADAITDGAGSGDYICVSDAHAFTSGGTELYQGPATGGPQLFIVNVDDSNCDQQAAAPATAHEKSTGNDDINWDGFISFYGMHFESESTSGTNNESDCFFYDCILNTDDYFGMQGDGDDTTFHNCTFKGFDANSYFRVGSGSVSRFYGGTWEPSTAFISDSGGNGTPTVEAYGVDFSAVTGYLVANTGGSYTDDGFNLHIDGCELNASLTGYVQETPVKSSMRFLITRSAATSAAAEYQYYLSTRGGVVEDDTGIYRDESTAFPSGTKVSLKCVTDTAAERGCPIHWDFPNRYAELSNTASDTIRIYLASTATLYDSDVWVELLYPDGTNKHTYNYLSTRHTDIMDTNGAALTTDSGSTWKNGASDLSGYNEYYIDVDTSGDAGADCYPIIRVYVAKASTTIYFDSEVVIA